MTKKTLSILNYDFRNKEERELFREQENALLGERKKDIISGLKRDGLLDENGKFVFEQALPDDMKPESLADLAYEITPQLQRDAHIDPGGFGFGL
jgi:hypothetical protein